MSTTTSATGAIDEPGRAPRGLVIGLLLGVVAVAFEAIAVATIMPVAGHDLGHVELYAWAFSSFVIGMGLANVLGGRVSDQFGPLPALAGGLALFALGLLVASLAPSMVVLVLGRLLQGLGGGAFNVSLMVVIGRVFPEHQRAQMMTWFSLCWVLPAFIAPPVAAWIAHTWSWHWVFGSILVLVLVTTALASGPLLRRREQLGPGRGTTRPVPIWAAVLVALSIGLSQWAAQELSQALGGAGSVLVSGCWLLLGLVGLVIGLPPLMPRGFVRFEPGIVSICWARAFGAGAFFATESFLPLALVTQRGVSPFWAGATLTVGSVGWTIGSWLQARPSLHVRRERLIIAGCAAVLLAVASVAVLSCLPVPFWAVGIAWIVAGLGMGLAMASGSLAVMSLSEPAQLGRNSSSLQLAESTGNALTIAAAGAVFAALRTQHQPAFTFSVVFATVSVVALAGVLVARRIGPVRVSPAE